MIYCDYNATAPLRLEAREAMLDAMMHQANASSVHGAGRDARRIIERARQSLSGVLGVRPDDLIFTSGGTEANALVLRGAMAKLNQGVLFYSDLEHPAVRDVVRSGAYETRKVKVTPQGVLDLADLEAQLTALDEAQTPLLTLMMANNETGIVQPVQDAAKLLREHDGYTHTDAVQAFGKIPVAIALLGVDYLTLSAHKIGGPQGVGAVWLRPGAPLLPQQIGGGQEKSLRSGTENLIGIAGFGAAMNAFDFAEESARISKLRDQFEAEIKSAAVLVFGQGENRLPSTSCFALEGFKGETQVMALDLAGFAVSSGSACSSGKVKPSSVLQAMGVSEDIAASALRVSFGWASEKEDATRLADAWKKAARRVRPELFKELA